MRWRPRRAARRVLSRCSAVEPQPPRQAAVVREHRALAEPLGQMMRHALGQPPRVDEHERRAVRVDQLREPVVDLGPHLVAGDGAELVLGNLDREVRSRGDGRCR